MIYSFELDDVDTKFAEAYAEETGETVGEMAKRFMLDGIEDVMAVRAADQAWKAYEADPVTYTLDEVESELMKNAI